MDRFVLAASYIFVFYMGYIDNRILIEETWLKGSLAYISLYFAFGVIILTLSIVALLKRN